MALVVLFFGALQIWLPKGTSAHKRLGYFLMVLMLLVAVGSFDIRVINETGGFSLIHLLSASAIVSVVLSYVSVRRKNVRMHKRSMIAVYVGFVVAGIFALAPGRFLFKAFLVEMG